MAQLNYYLGLQRGVGTSLKDANITIGTATNGTSSDVELNLQITNVNTATGLTKKDVLLALKAFEKFIVSGGLDHAGASLPAL